MKRSAKRIVGGAISLALATALWGPALPAQSLTTGSLLGTVRTDQGEPLPDVAVTIEDQGGGVIRELSTRQNGGFALRMMLPGTYRILVEVPGYQPVRLLGVVVASGRTTTVAVELIERPPPITSVTEITQSGTTSGPTGRVVLEREIRSLDFRRDAGDLGRDLSDVVAPLDGRTGLALAAAGLPGSRTRAYVDGIPEIMLRHPGLPGEPAGLPAFAREALVQGQVFGGASDTEWRGNAGSLVSLISRSGKNRMEFAPYLAASSASLGGNSALNPADSSGTSLLAGFTFGGAIKPDTAHFFLQGSFLREAIPSPFPWEEPSGTGTPLREPVLTAAQDRYGTDVAASVLPMVTVRKGGSGLGRLDWRVGRNSRVTIRASAGSQEETNPRAGHEPGHDAGARLSSRDFSLGASLTTMAVFANELRVGAALSRREWDGAGLPETRLAHEGVRFGGNAAFPGRFESQVFSLSDAVSYQSGSHTLKGGVSLDLTTYTREFSYGGSGRFLYGGVAEFEAGTGAVLQAAATVPEVRVSAPDLGLFLQDNWNVSPGFDLLLGVRYDLRILPKNRIVAPALWRLASGLVVDTVPRDLRGIQPRIGFVLSPGEGSGWTLQGGAGLYSTGMDLAQLAEVIHHNEGNVKVRRAVGAVSWPQPGAGTPAANRLALLGAPGQYRAPRTLKSSLAVSRVFPGGVNFRLFGAYHHSDYLPRRTDANLAAAPFGEAQDGRPVWGLLVKQGGLVTAVPGTSRRFSDFDLVTIMTPTGFSDYYEAGLGFGVPLGRTVSLAVDYVFSRTRDNLVGLLEPDPADQLSPFPGGVSGLNWDEGRSDLDVPHRLAGTLDFQTGGRNPVVLSLRGRYRSGLPFTPGFHSGVDVNGDLGGNNDPVSADAVVITAGSSAKASCERLNVGGFAGRNSCRQSGVGSLDARLGVPLPLGSGPARLLVTVEAFNLVATATGVVDRAALLVDPAGSFSANPGTGAVQIPYLANPRFGTLLRRGGEPRVIRLGLRVEY